MVGEGFEPSISLVDDQGVNWMLSTKAFCPTELISDLTLALKSGRNSLTIADCDRRASSCAGEDSNLHVYRLGDATLERRVSATITEYQQPFPWRRKSIGRASLRLGWAPVNSSRQENKPLSAKNHRPVV